MSTMIVWALIMVGPYAPRHEEQYFPTQIACLKTMHKYQDMSRKVNHGKWKLTYESSCESRRVATFKQLEMQ